MFCLIFLCYFNTHLNVIANINKQYEHNPQTNNFDRLTHSPRHCRKQNRKRNQLLQKSI